MPETIERPRDLDIPERRSLTALFLDPPEVRTAEDGSGWTFVGYAAVFDRLSVDLGGFRERILRGAFKDVLADPELDVTLVADHGLGALTTVASIRGGTLQLSEDSKGLRVEANIAPTTVGNDLKILIQRGDVQGMSFGFSVAEGGDAWMREGDETIRSVRKVRRLWDTSIVSFPAYPDTDVEVRGLLVERRNRLDLFDPTTGRVDAEEVRRVQAKVQARLLELSREQRAALERAAALIPAAPAGARMIADAADLRQAIREIVRADARDVDRARVATRAAELGVPGLVPGNWAADGALRDARPWATVELRETYNDLYQGLSAALEEIFVTNGDHYYCWVQDFTATEVIFAVGGNLHSAPYTVTAGGPIEIGEHVQVRPVTEFVSTGRAATPSRDRLERRVRLMGMQL